MLAPPPAEAVDGGLRILYYSHDSFGLGHLQRTLALAHSVRARRPDSTQLIVSGAAYTDGWALPAGADWLKLPSVVKTGSGAYRSRSLQCSFETTRELRQELVLAAARRFRPDVFVVDHAPAGLDGEALPALHHAAAAGSRLVLGLRDVLDDATLVHRAWRKARTHALLDGLYDDIVVYGDPTVYDVVGEYGFSEVAARKTQYLGYLRAPQPAPAAEVRARLGLNGDRLLLVTAGGGGDGYSLISAALDSLVQDRLERTTALVVTGPLMGSDERMSAAERAAGYGDRVRVVDAVTSLGDVVAAADAVVSMGGYNTVREILTYGRPALIVPRVRPRLEQFVRAEALARRGLVRTLHPAELTPERFGLEVRTLLDGAAPRPLLPRMDGLERFVDVIDDLADPTLQEEALAHA